MPDRLRENRYFDRLMAALPQLSECAVAKGESPDFVVDHHGRKIGVEMTEFHLPPADGGSPYQEVSALRWRVVERAEDVHASKGGLALYVDVAFRDRPRLTKKRILSLADELASAVLRTPAPLSLQSPPSEVDWDHLPDELVEVWFWPSIDGKDKLWQPAEAGWVATILPEHIASVIEKKGQRAAAYREKCDEVWLVITNHPTQGAPAELGASAATASYSSPFQRLLWFNPVTGAVRTLRGADV